MLPTWLMKILIFIVSVAVPTFAAIYSLAWKDSKEGRHEGKRDLYRWLNYFTFYCVTTYLFKLVEPAMLAMTSLLPTSFYWEGKFLLYFAAVVPRTGLLDKVEAAVHTLYEVHLLEFKKHIDTWKYQLMSLVSSRENERFRGERYHPSDR
eukprot:GHVU01204673.1.p2 GENE.GHVU01204673.1~~GHVU01204673.1.p2  ORF type:complete len:150 (+),score=14.43 GHVU01204673.1:207-656(+)